MSTALQLPRGVEDALRSIDPRPRAAASWRPRRAGLQPGRRHAARRPRARASRRAARPVSRSRLPAARHLDRDPSRQHRDVLRRQDRWRPGHGHRIPPDDVRRAGHRLRQDQSRHGLHGHHAGPGRLGRFRRHRARWLADAPRRRRSAARPARTRRRAHWACRCGCSRSRNATISLEVRSRRSVDLRRAGRRQTLQRRAHRTQRRRHHRQGRGEAGAASCASSASRSSATTFRQGGRIAEVGRGHEAARHGACAQRPAAVRGRARCAHRRVVGGEPAGLRPRGQPRQLRGGGLRARGAGHPRRAAAEGGVETARRRAVPGLQRAVRLHARRHAHVERASRRSRAIRPRRSPAPRASSKPSTRCRSRGTRRSVRRMRWPIRPTAR